MIFRKGIVICWISPRRFKSCPQRFFLLLLHALSTTAAIAARSGCVIGDKHGVFTFAV
jgi:hypothetical protein